MEGSEKSFKETVKGGELFKGKLTRCKTAKSNLTRSLTSFENCVKDFIESETPTTPLATKKRKARLVMEGMDKMELKVETLRATMQEFIVYVSGLSDDAFEAPTTPTSIMVGANTDADEREQAMRDKMAEHEQVIRRAEVILASEIVPTQQVVEKPDDTKFSSFRPQADLRPQILEREANYKESLHFTEIFSNYLSNGYGGTARIPQQMIAVQLQPFINPIWWSQMITKQVKQKDLEGAMLVVLEVASDNNPVHGRRMDLLKLRRGSMDHSTFLFKLEELMELTMYHEWSKEKMIIHLFLEGADTEMARIATNMLAKDTVSLPDLRYEVRATENSTWYKRPLHVKYTQEKDNWETEGLGGARGSGRQPGSVRWCGDCRSKTHTPETCWGP